jgi:hypothetical protein
LQARGSEVRLIGLGQASALQEPEGPKNDRLDATRSMLTV